MSTTSFLGHAKKRSWPWVDPVDPSIYLCHQFWPKISIITPSFNQGKYIEETILSVINQNYPNLEFIIIDGGSIDQTVEIIKKYNSKITFWTSEKDNGQADALNKGIEKCTGEIFNWINSDDYLTKNALFNLALEFDLKNYDLFAACVNNFDEISKISTLFKNNNLDIRKFLHVNKQANYYYHQPGIWFNLYKYKELGLLDTSLRYCFDHDFTLRYLVKNNKVKYSDLIVVNFRYHSESKSISEQAHFDSEFGIAYKNFYYSLPFFHKLKVQAKRRYKSYQWHLSLKTICESQNGKSRKVILILKEIFKSPFFRATRFTAGTLKKLLSE
jgi:glycosyltransferase involved in cell wall biosynthesis